MFDDLREIKRMRKKLNLTQFQLAKLSSVSQSLIAKIESNKIDPTYSKTQMIFDTLTTLSRKTEKKANELMTKKVITVKPDDKIADVIRLMKKHQISQVPVIEGNVCQGVVSESAILEGLLDKKFQIKEIMDDCPPIISKDTSIIIISQLLKTYSLVLISEKGKISGLLTKSDLIDNLL